MKFNHIPVKTPVIETAHTESGHYYSIDNNTYPSITTILHSFPNKGIEIWKSRTPNWRDIQNESLSVGTALHSFIENYLNNVDYIPVGRDIWIVTGVDGNPVYEQHRRNYYAAVAGMGLLYAVHGLYLYREHRDGKFPGWNQLELSWSRNPDFSRGGIGQGTNIDLKFSYSF